MEPDTTLFTGRSGCLQRSAAWCKTHILKSLEQYLGSDKNNSVCNVATECVCQTRVSVTEHRNGWEEKLDGALHSCPGERCRGPASWSLSRASNMARHVDLSTFPGDIFHIFSWGSGPQTTFSEGGGFSWNHLEHDWTNSLIEHGQITFHSCSKGVGDS